MPAATRRSSRPREVPLEGASPAPRRGTTRPRRLGRSSRRARAPGRDEVKASVRVDPTTGTTRSGEGHRGLGGAAPRTSGARSSAWPSSRCRRPRARHTVDQGRSSTGSSDTTSTPCCPSTKATQSPGAPPRTAEAQWTEGPGPAAGRVEYQRPSVPKGQSAPSASRVSRAGGERPSPPRRPGSPTASRWPPAPRSGARAGHEAVAAHDRQR